MEEKLKITVKADGSTTIKVIGVKGAGCKVLTRDFEKALGKTVKSVETPEMRETVGRVQRQNQQ